MLDALRTLRNWPPRRWGVAALVGAGYLLLVAVPTDLIDTPWFSRDVPPTWWAWPALAVSAVLVGLLAATYVAATARGSARDGGDPQHRPSPPRSAERPQRFALSGGALTFFAVGCPVCNKIVLLALGYAGALTWFQPLQPLLQAGAIILLGWALVARLRGAVACPVDAGRPDESTPAPTPSEHR